MNFKPTLEIAKNSVKECILEYNKNFNSKLTAQDLENLKQEYEKDYKSGGEGYLKSFKMYTITEIALIILEVLCLDYVRVLTLTEEEIELVAQELYERWV